MRLITHRIGRITSGALLALIAGAGIAACNIDATPTPVAGGTGSAKKLSEAKAGLVAVQSCGDLESYVKGVAAAEIEKQGVGVSKGTPLPVPFASGQAGTPTSAGSNEGGGTSGTGTGGTATGGTTGGTSGGGTGAPSAPKDSNTSTGAGPTHSETNNQIAGVDEADIVKTDGSYLYILNGRSLRILKSHPAKETALVGSLDLGANHGAFELFLQGDVAMVYGRSWGALAYDGGGYYGGIGYATDVAVGAPTDAGGGFTGGTSGTATGTSTGSAPSSGGSASSGGSGSVPKADTAAPIAPPAPTGLANLRGSVTLLSVIDLKDRANPKLLRSVALEGNYLSARKIGSVVYTAVTGQLFMPNIGWINWSGGGTMGTVGTTGALPPNSTSTPPSAGTGGTSGSEAGTSGSTGSSDPSGSTPTPKPSSKPGVAPQGYDTPEAYKAAYLAELGSQTAADWLPKYTDSKSGTEAQLLGGCTGFYKPTVDGGLTTISLIALDLATPDAALAASTTLGQASGVVYASANAVYVASYPLGYWYWSDAAGAEKDQSEYSFVHKFALKGTAVAYAGSGKIPGQVLNQFSLDEHQGNLRVATTIHDWNKGNEGLSNSVTILTEKDGALAKIGAVDGLAKGERIYSARFLGNRGFVVTYKNTDPLFALDLSNPTAPKVAGELKIPGFSTYIHPLAENYLLTIGRDTFDNGQWVEVKGVQLQIFDVTTLSDPKLAHKQTFGKAGTESEALYDHKAFAFFEEKGLLALPYAYYGYADGGGTTVDPDEGGTGGTSGGSSTGTSTGEASGSGSGSSGSGGTGAVPTPASEPTAAQKPDAGVKIFSVSATKGLAELGNISHSDFLPASGTLGSYWYNLQVRRTVLIEDALYTIGSAGVKVNSAADLSALAQVSFPQEDLCGGWDYCYGGGGMTPAGGTATGSGGTSGGTGGEAPPQK